MGDVRVKNPVDVRGALLVVVVDCGVCNGGDGEGGLGLGGDGVGGDGDGGVGLGGTPSQKPGFGLLCPSQIVSLIHVHWLEIFE